MNDLDKALAFTFKNEGGYSDNPADKGGRTNMGITYGTLCAAYKAGLVSHTNIRLLTREEAAKIYERNYWLAGKCHLMLYPLNVIHFDTAVLHGKGGAAKVLQRALTAYTGEYLADDGAIGKRTLDKLATVPQDKIIEFVCKYYLTKRSLREVSIWTKNPSQKVFANGWANRTERCRQYVLKNGGVKC